MSRKRTLPPRVYAKHGAYYFVDVANKWHKLCRVDEGLPAMYQALAKIVEAKTPTGHMPKLIADWQQTARFLKLSKKERAEKILMCQRIADEFEEFTAGQVKAKHWAAFLEPWSKAGQARMHNRYRSLASELMRFAVVEDHRDDNPVDHIPTMTERARDVYITDSQRRRIKVAAMYGDDGKRTRSGEMLCALIDMAYLTGQRIGDLLELRWSRQQALGKDATSVIAPYVGEDGIYFKPSKTSGSTGAKVMIEWTPKLQDVMRRLRAVKKRNLQFVFITQDAQRYTYWGASSAWQRARARAGIKGVTFNDLRAKALTDKEETEGMRAARTMGAHSTEAQTADYVRRKKARAVKATR
jgi:integrase